MDLDAELMQKFSCLGTTDKDVLIGEFQRLLGFQLSPAGCAFFLDMTNWCGAGGAGPEGSEGRGPGVTAGAAQAAGRGGGPARPGGSRRCRPRRPQARPAAAGPPGGLVFVAGPRSPPGPGGCVRDGPSAGSGAGPGLRVRQAGSGPVKGLRSC